MKKYAFPKREKLCSELSFTELFNSGNSFFEYPFKIFWRTIPLPNVKTPPLLFAVSVSKRSFKKALIRNLLKRRIREAYRLNKQQAADYFSLHNLQCHLLFIYVEKKEIDYPFLKEKIIVSLNRLLQHHDKIIGKTSDTADKNL